MTDRRAAALLRSEGVRAPADRPSQRRCSPDAGAGLGLARGGSCRLAPAAQHDAVRLGAAVDVTISSATFRTAPEPADAPLVFEGFASVTGQGYEMYDMFGPYTEYVHVGAFAETLAQPDLDVPLVLDHVSSQRLARTGNTTSPLLLTEVAAGETTGLRVLAPSLQRDNPWVARIEPLLRSGLIDEMSFRFRITSGRWNDDFDEYHIHAVDIHRGDVAIVGYGANPHTAGSGLRSQPTRLPSIRSDEGKLRVLAQ